MNGEERRLLKLAVDRARRAQLAAEDAGRRADHKKPRATAGTEVAVRADPAPAALPADVQAPASMDYAARWALGEDVVRAALASGPCSGKEVKASLRDLGLTGLQAWRLKRQLGVKSSIRGVPKGSSVWFYEGQAA